MKTSVILRMVLKSSTGGYITSYVQLDPLRIPYFTNKSILTSEVFLGIFWLISFLVEVKQLIGGISAYVRLLLPVRMLLMTSSDRWNFLDLMLHTLMIALVVKRIERYVGYHSLAS